jgi:hypothetical protein
MLQRCYVGLVYRRDSEYFLINHKQTANFIWNIFLYAANYKQDNKSKLILRMTALTE